MSIVIYDFTGKRIGYAVLDNLKDSLKVEKKEYEPVAFSIGEGQEWIPFPSAHAVFKHEELESKAPIRLLYRGKIVNAHAVKFEDGTIWDEVNGIRPREKEVSWQASAISQQMVERLDAASSTIISTNSCAIPDEQEKDPLTRLRQEQENFVCRFTSLQQILMTLQNDLGRKEYTDCGAYVRSVMKEMKRIEDAYLFTSRHKISMSINAFPAKE